MDYNILVNKDNPLPRAHIPSTLVEASSSYKDGILIDRETKNAFDRMKQDALRYGYHIDIESGYRDYDYQEKIYNKLLIKENTSKKSNYYKIELTNNLIIDNLEFNIIDNTENDSNYICRIDKSTIALPLYFRNRIDGDYIILKGSNNKKKIKEIMIENKLPISQRITYPILIDSNNNIIWIPGIKKSKFCSKKNEKYDIIIECKEREENYE